MGHIVGTRLLLNTLHRYIMSPQLHEINDIYYINEDQITTHALVVQTQSSFKRKNFNSHESPSDPPESIKKRRVNKDLLASPSPNSSPQPATCNHANLRHLCHPCLSIYTIEYPIH
jgi:hypothetical protein